LFIQRFSLVHNTIPRISSASVVVAFRQGVRDEKVLEKLTTHDIQDVTELFNLSDKCARTVEGHAWHTSPAPKEGKDSMPDAGTTAQGGGNNKNKNKMTGGNNQPLVGAPTAATAMAGGYHGPRGDKLPRQASGSNDGGAQCLVHNSTHHSVSEYWEIKKPIEQFCEKQQQPCQEGTPSC
jgi:hypothetical protein